MRKFLYGCVIAFSGLATSGYADYGYGYAGQDGCYPSQCDPCCNNNSNNGFNGFYIGGNVGGFSHTAHRNDLDGFLLDNSGWSTVEHGWEAGVQLGYDWTFCCNKVLGLVVDWSWADADHRVNDDPNAAGTRYIRSKHNWFTTIRGRLGFSVCDALVYVTAGGVVARTENRWFDSAVAGGSFNHDKHRWGWVGGVGTELLLGCNWSLGAEILYLSFSDNVRSFSAGGATFDFGASDTSFVGRVLLNYRFGDLCGCFF